MNLTFDRHVFLRGKIDDKLAEDVIAQLLFYQMEDAQKPVRLIIDSPGGSATATLAIYDTIKFVKPPVQTLCRGQAIGAALLLLGSGTKGFRSAGSDAYLGMVPLQFFGPSTNPKAAAQFFDKLKRRFISYFAADSGQTDEVIAQRMEDETIFTPEGLLEFGLIDKVDE